MVVRVTYRPLPLLPENFGTREGCFKIKGKPAVYLYHAYKFSGDVEEGMTEVRESVKKGTSSDLFLIGNTVTWKYTDDESNVHDVWPRPYDAITGPFDTTYGHEGDKFPGSIEDNEGSLRRLHSEWSSYAHSFGIHFIPTAMPGFASIRPKDKDLTVLPKSTKRFAEQLKVCMDFLDDEIRHLFAISWNDDEESDGIEPTVQEGYKYLQTLRDTIASE